MDSVNDKMIKAFRLKPGDTIGIVAPAGPFDPKKFRKGVDVIESMGFYTYFDEEIFQKHGFLAGTDEQRAGQINRFFADPAIHAIICARGGYGSLRTLPFIDFETVCNNPKIFVGFSDISVLLSVFTQRCNLVTFHGPVVTTLGSGAKDTIAELKMALTSHKPLALAPKKSVAINPGVSSGMMTGGNLTTLCHLLGTPYMPDLKEKIMLIEDTGEALYRIDRMLNHMKFSGCFDSLKGLVLGSFEKCGKMESIYQIVKNIFHDIHIPILGGFEIGHGNVNITIPIGIEATLDADRQTLVFHEVATDIAER